MKMEDRFYFDGQLHIPSGRVAETLALAIERGLDGIVFTDYGNTEIFENIVQNRNREGREVLGKGLDRIQRTPTLVEVMGEKGRLFVIKGEEVETKQGHLLAWNIHESIPNGLSIDESVLRVYNAGGIPIFSHLLMRSFHGCGKEVFDAICRKYERSPLGVEQNGQIPAWLKTNEKVRMIAERYGVACFGTSDIHGKYLAEHKKVGLRLYTNIPRIDMDNFTEGLREIMLKRPEEVHVMGVTNSLIETMEWNGDAVRRKGFPKLRELAAGFYGTILKR